VGVARESLEQDVSEDSQRFYSIEALGADRHPFRLAAGPRGCISERCH